MAPTSRKYTESEIGALIQRATELHAAARAAEGELSLEEVERIAADLGVPSEYVHTAAVEMATGREEVRERSVSGAPFRMRVAELIDGEIDDDAWADIVMELRRSVSTSGKTEEIGSMREWKSVFEDMGTTLGGTQVIVRNRDEQSTIELERFYSGTAGVAYIMGAIFGFMVTGASLDGSGLPPWVILPIAASGAVGGLAAVRAGISMWEQKQRQRMQRLMGRLSKLAGSRSAPQRKSDQAEPEQAPVIDSPQPAIEIPDEPEESWTNESDRSAGRERYS